MIIKWTVDRSNSLGNVFARIKKKILRFPRLEESASFLDDIAAEIAEYDNYYRSIRYTHPDSTQDDALHAINYLSLLANMVY